MSAIEHDFKATAGVEVQRFDALVKLNELEKLIDAQFCLPQNRFQRRRADVSGVDGNRREKVSILHLDMASLLADRLETGALKSMNEALRPDLRQFRHGPELTGPLGC